MSSIRLSSSMRRLAPKFLQSKTIEEHNFLFGRAELQAMHGSQGYLAEMGGVRGLAFSLRTDPLNGLYEDEVKEGNFRKRKLKYGNNVFPREPLKSFWEHCYEALTDGWLVRILILAAIVSIIVGSIEHPKDGWIEGVAIMFAVVIVVLVGAGNNYNQERQFRSLDDEKEPPKSTVLRNGESKTVLNEDIVVGDVLDLSAGNYIPADGIFVGDATTPKIACDHSALTGESDDIPKDFSSPFLFAGTSVRQGLCHMLITSVGMDTEWGRIMKSLQETSEPTPLQKKLARTAQIMGYIGTGTAIVLFLVLIIWWIVDLVKKGHRFVDEIEVLIDAFIIAVTVVVVAIPEGLPLAVNISLAYSMKKMYKDKILVKVLSACETMGNATTICSDKTGTLTQNLMTVTRVMLGQRDYGQAKIPDSGKLSGTVRRLLIESIMINSRASVAAKDMVKTVKPELWAWTNGNATEVALLAWLIRYDIDVEDERRKCVVEKIYPFDSAAKFSSIIVELKSGGYRRYFKGASERLLAMCNRTIDENGHVVTLDEGFVDNFITGMTNNGLRTVSFIYTDFPSLARDENQQLMDPPLTKDCVFIGVAGIQDPLRPDTRFAVRTCQRAGVVVRMVTGDHLNTARYIAKDCGILTDEKVHYAMTGDEFRAMMARNNQKELAEFIPRLRVLARSQPTDKRTLVNYLKDHCNDVVAVTGDGTNDAPALKAAHIGIAMNAGTDVAKQAAETVIIDNRFSSIVRSCMWGRSVYDNIAKFVQFQLTVNVVALAITLIGAFSGYENPLKAVQLLWVNLIMDTMGALALGTEKPTPRLLDRKPYRPDATLISPAMWRMIFAQAALQLTVLCIITFAGHRLFPDTTLRDVHHYTLVFNAFVFLQFFNEINARRVDERLNVFEGFFDNFLFSGILLVTAFMQALMVEVFGPFAETTGLNWYEWLITIAIGVLSLPIGLLARVAIPVNYEAGRITTITPDTFKGATLDAYEEGERDYLSVHADEELEQIKSDDGAPLK